VNHLLDEPTTGLDPRSRHTIWQIIRDLVAGGDTIFLTTQYLKEADQLADSIAVLEHGKLVAQESMAGLRSGAVGKTLEEIFLSLVGADHPDKPALDWLA